MHLGPLAPLVGATGIEPVSEAYKVSALTIVLRADTDCRLLVPAAGNDPAASAV